MTEITRRALAAAAPLAVAAAPAFAQPAGSSPWPDATELAARIRRREISSAEATEAAIRAAEALQGTLNFIVNSDFDRALAKARAGGQTGPFAGVPFLVKDLNDYAGLPTRSGSQSRRLAGPAARQTDYVTAFDRAGFVVIGKSATPEEGFLPTTEPVAFGPTRNPWDLTRSSGGSSGGAAAAVAAGVVPVAHASDGGGSIRIPASSCGLFGLKPSRGRMLGARAEMKVTNIGVDHCVARSVRDSAALFAATEDASPGGPYPPVGWVTPARRKRRLRVGLLMEGFTGQKPSPEVEYATLMSARLCSTLGHRVEPTRLPFDGTQFIQDFLLLWAAGALELAQGVQQATGRRPDATLLEPFSLGLAEMAMKAGSAALPPLIQRLEANALAYDTWFVANQFDVVLSPVLADVPPPLGYLAPTVPFEELVRRLIAFVGYTPVHNVAGAPSMSVPLNWTQGGLPVGTMFSARRGAERTLFELAYQLEAAQPWAARRPPVHA